MTSREAKPKKWSGRVDNCDICLNPINTTYFIDGATKSLTWHGCCIGPWALMCEDCFKEVGLGLGLGRGQKYSVKTKEKVEG